MTHRKRFPWIAVSALVIAGAMLALVQYATSGEAPERSSIVSEEYLIGGFAVGTQAYTFNRFSVMEAIEKTAQAGGRVIEFYPGQRFSPDDGDLRWDHNATPEMIEAVEAKLQEHDLKAVNFGVVALPADIDESRKVFEFAQRMGIPIITSAPSEAEMDTIEQLVQEYDIKVAIHNHPPRPDQPEYRIWDPNYVREMVADRDPRIGACADTGHWVRSGIRPVDALRILEGRVISVHLKDVDRFEREGEDVIFGTGVSDIAGILDELKRQNFNGNISIEYESNWYESVPDVAQCVGFIRGWAAARERADT